MEETVDLCFLGVSEEHGFEDIAGDVFWSGNLLRSDAVKPSFSSNFRSSLFLLAG
jgi:hypothetical protein